jgi:hypothetical protein
MATAKITKKDGYRCAPDGIRVSTFGFGEIVEGKVADWALADKAAQRMFDPREDTKVEKVLETKVRTRSKKGQS